jgi:hypothetical protein
MGGKLSAAPPALLSDEDRADLKRFAAGIRSLLEGADFAPLAEIQRIAALVGTDVHYRGQAGLLIGVFRDRAVIDRGGVLLSVNVAEVEKE